MSVFLYQIGDVAIHLHGQLFKAADHAGAGKATQLLWSHEFRWPNRQYKPELRRQTISGLLLGDCTWRADQLYERLQRLVDVPTDIIGYVDISCCNDIGCCACQNSGGCNLVWYQNYGVLRSVKITNRDDNSAIDIAIEIEYGAYWQPLSRYFWEWGSYIGNPPRPAAPTTPYSRAIVPYPRCSTIFGDCNECNQFKRRIYTDQNVGYDPGLWVAEVCQLAPGYVIPGVAESWVTGHIAKNYWNDPSVWNAPILSVYAFRNLPQTGTLSITVQRSNGVWENISESTTIDLANVSGLLTEAGYGGLMSTDILYIGDLERKPGFIMRGGAIIDTPRPAVNYPSEWPGYITPGTIKLDVSAPGSSEIAYKHAYRRM